jgi:hypothetical protein
MAIDLPTIQTRVIARNAGIPTISEDVHCGAELLHRRGRAEDAACVDLYTQSAFWLSGNYPIDEQRFYSMTDVTPAKEQLLLAYIGGRSNGHSMGSRENDDASSIAHSTLHEASSAAQYLAEILNLEYAFFSFSVTKTHPEFCRVDTCWPGKRNDPLVHWTAGAVVAALIRS